MSTRRWPWIGTQSRPSGPTDSVYGCTPLVRYRTTRRVAVSTTATPLPDLSFSYIETKTRRPSCDAATKRGVLRNATDVTRRVAASTTDRTRELWFATYTVRPSGETATPSGSAPTRTVPTTAGVPTLATRLVSGTRATAAGPLAGADPDGVADAAPDATV